MKFSSNGNVSFRKKGKPSGEMALQITAMADIMVVILVFMLKSYTSGAAIIPASGTTLPAAVAEEAFLEALKVEVSQTAILVEGNPVTTLENFTFPKGDQRNDLALNSLGEALQKERKRQMVIAKVNDDVKVDARILIIADQKAPYRLIKAVLASAAVNGYTDFKLAVVRKDG